MDGSSRKHGVRFGDGEWFREPMGLEDKSRMGAGLEGVDSVVREREREGMFMVEDGSAML